jgi:hypothetical protein
MIIRIVALSIAATMVLTASAIAQTSTRTFYDSSGREVGRSTTQGNTTTFR